MNLRFSHILTIWLLKDLSETPRRYQFFSMRQNTQVSTTPNFRGAVCMLMQPSLAAVFCSGGPRWAQMFGLGKGLDRTGLAESQNQREHTSTLPHTQLGQDCLVTATFKSLPRGRLKGSHARQAPSSSKSRCGEFMAVCCWSIFGSMM